MKNISIRKLIEIISKDPIKSISGRFRIFPGISDWDSHVLNKPGIDKIDEDELGYDVYLVSDDNTTIGRLTIDRKVLDGETTSIELATNDEESRIIISIEADEVYHLELSTADINGYVGNFLACCWVP